MDLPRHPLLRPGVRVTRRGDAFLQVGLDAPHAVVLPDTARLRDAIAAIERGQAPEVTDLEVAGLCRRLLDARLIVDGDALLSDLAATAVHAAYGPDAPAALAGRGEGWVEVLATDDLRAEVARWLPRVHGTGPPIMSLVASAGPRARDELDDLVRAGRPHLLVATVEGRVELGPFVMPGQTACLRCLDAHRGERDPRRSLVLEQYAAAGPRRDGVPEPVDEPVFATALAWAARDCLTWLEGYRPTLWSRSITFGPGMAADDRTWMRHPHCGCAWAELRTG